MSEAAVIYLALGVTTIVTARRVPAFFFAWSIVVLVPFAVNASLFEPRYTYLSTLPFIAFWVTLGTTAARGISDQWRERSSLALAIALPLAIVVLGNQTRQQQSRIGVQAAEYQATVRATREQCGDLPPGSHVYLLGSGADDPFQVNLRAAINVFYEHIYVGRREPPAVAEPGRTCVVSVPAVPQ